MTAGLSRLVVHRKTGDEKLHADGDHIGPTLLNFWKWSMSDLVSNVTRGVLAEFIVAVGLGVNYHAVRDEWDAYDLETNIGIKIEVKSAAFVQSWYQKKLSNISFRTPKTLVWDPDTNTRSKEPSRIADVYVFALLAHKEKKSIDPLNVNQWKFFVVPTVKLDNRTRSQHSITLKSLESITGGSVGFANHELAVEDAYQAQN